HVDAAVFRLDVEAGAIPAIAAEVDGESAIGRLAADVAADVREGDAAVHRVEVRGSPEIADRDAAVVRAEREDRRPRHLELEADRPAAVAARRGPLGPDRTAAGHDAHAGHELARLGLGVGRCLYTGSHVDVRAIRPVDANAAVLPGIDLER